MARFKVSSARAPALLRAQADAATPGDGVVRLDLFGPVGEGDFTTAGVAARLPADAKEIRIRLNTEGGYTVDGFAIYNLLRDHPAKVYVDVIAAAMSAGSYILLAADHSRIARNGVVMVHEAWGGVDGRAQDFERAAAELKRINSEMVATAAAKTGHSVDEIGALFAAETYLSAAEAVKWGFVTELMPEPASARALAQLNPTALAKAPRDFLAACAAARKLGAKNQMTLEEILAAISAMTDEEKAQLQAALTEMMGTPAVDPAAAAKAAAAKAAAEGPGVNADPGADPGATPANPDAAAILEQLAALLGIAKPSARGVFGAVAQMRAGADEATQLRSQVQALEARAEQADLESVLAKNSKRVPPAMAAKIRTQFAAKTITLAGVKALVEGMPETATGAGPRAAHGGEQLTDLKWKGKAFKDLSPNARATLKRDEPELHDAMRAQWLADGKPSA